MAPKRADELLLVLHDTEKERAHDGSLCFCVGIQDDTRRMNFNSDSVGRSQSMNNVLNIVALALWRRQSALVFP